MNIELTCDRSNEVLDILKNNSYYCFNITNCISLLKKLNVLDFKLTYNDESVNYVNGKLTEYTNHILEYKNQKINIIKNENVGNYEIQEFLRKKKLLDEVNNIELYKLDSLLVSSYRLFCNENPNFKNDEIKNRIQILAYFLSFVLSPIHYSTYFTRFENETPYNELIKYEMDKLEAFNNGELNDLIMSDKIKNDIISLMTKLNADYKDCTLLDLVKLYHDYYNNSDKDAKALKFIKCIKKK